MPLLPRCELLPMSETSLDGCDVRPGRGLFEHNKYIVNNKNIKRFDIEGNEYLFTKGYWVVGSIPMSIFYKSLENAHDYKQAKQALKLYMSHLKQQNTHPVKFCFAYLVGVAKVFRARG